MAKKLETASGNLYVKITKLCKSTVHQNQQSNKDKHAATNVKIKPTYKCIICAENNTILVSNAVIESEIFPRTILHVITYVTLARRFSTFEA